MDSHIPSLYQFSAADAALVVDYSRDVAIDDGVVNRLPPRVVIRVYAPLPSPLFKEKRMVVRLRHVSPSRGDTIARRGLSHRFRMEAPQCDPSPVNSVPPPANSSTIIGPPCLASPHYSTVPQFNRLRMLPLMPHTMPIVPEIDVTKAKVPFFVYGNL